MKDLWILKKLEINVNDDSEKITNVGTDISSNESENDDSISVHSEDNKSVHSQESCVSNSNNSVQSTGEQTQSSIDENDLSQHLDIELRSKNILGDIKKRK